MRDGVGLDEPGLEMSQLWVRTGMCCLSRLPGLVPYRLPCEYRARMGRNRRFKLEALMESSWRRNSGSSTPYRRS